MPRLQFTILGCGSSGGVPRIGGHWGACDPSDPRNRRTRCSILIQLVDGQAATRVLIDSSPDLRQQLLAAKIGDLDGVVYTHAHADHVNGLDDFRAVYLNRGSPLPVWADQATSSELMARFSYAFVQPLGSSYPPILKLHPMQELVEVPGAAGTVVLEPFPVMHGDIICNGFRIAGLAYVPDVKTIEHRSWSYLCGLDCLILDALRRDPHPTHIHLEQSLDWISRAAPKRAILTNLHIDLDYGALLAETPPNVEPAYDGLTITFEV